MASSQKPPAQKLRCFIAMAFDHTDTDEIFETLKAVLRDRNISSVRVDRIEHNDDIDDRIMTEIKNADFMIADLTYARPSVYFEAGFAQRNVPVIYTARHDHLRPQMEDPHENLRVHFDLQMKNIIPWKSSRDSLFRQRLKSRVAHVTAPLLKQRASGEVAKKRTEDFERQSLVDRSEYLRTSVRRHFASLKYTALHNDEAGVPSRSLGVAVVCAKRDASRFRYVCFAVLPSINKEVCDYCRLFLIRKPPYSQELINSPEWTPSSLSEETVICSFGRSGAARMAKEIPQLRRDGDVLRLSATWDIVHPERTINVEREVHVRVIESLPILANFADELKTLYPASI